MDAVDEPVENKASIVRLTEETKSTLPRYYYAEYDTEIHPTWSRDGKRSCSCRIVDTFTEPADSGA